MRRIISRLQEQRGQVMVMFIGVFTVIAVVGLVVVDFGLWFSERRGAQTDADLSALAAARELLSCTSLSDPQASTVQQAANDRAWEYAQLNDVTDPDNVHLPDPSDPSVWTGCWEDEGDTSDTIDSFPLDVEHPTRALFGSIFGLLSPQGLGAHARACVGSIVSVEGAMPVGVPMKNADESALRELCWDPDDGDADDLPEPLYGKRCDLSVTDKDSGEAGWLDLDNPAGEPSLDCSVKGGVGGPGGAEELEREITRGGANTVCRVAPLDFEASDCTDAMPWCVWSKTGVGANKIMGAFEERFKGEGACDITGGDNIDDFYGSFELTSAPGTEGTEDAVYKPICESPRTFTLIVLDNFNSKANPLMPVRAFAVFFLEACVNDGVEYPKCNPPPGNPIGQFYFVGRFVNIRGEGPVSWPTDWSPKRIVLDE